MKRLRRESWAIVLVFLHLFVAPCATAMILMPADMDCEHCQTNKILDDCAVASAVSSSVIEGLAFDSGRADPPLHVAQVGAVLLAGLAPSSSGAMMSARSSRSVATRHNGDPPLWLRLGQLRI